MSKLGKFAMFWLAVMVMMRDGAPLVSQCMWRMERFCLQPFAMCAAGAWPWWLCRVSFEFLLYHMSPSHFKAARNMMTWKAKFNEMTTRNPKENGTHQSKTCVLVASHMTLPYRTFCCGICNERGSSPACVIVPRFSPPLNRFKHESPAFRLAYRIPPNHYNCFWIARVAWFHLVSISVFGPSSETKHQTKHSYPPSPNLRLLCVPTEPNQPQKSMVYSVTSATLANK